MTRTYGTQQRAKASIQVLRGWDPNNPTSRTRLAPTMDGVNPMSGQVISLTMDNGVEKWQLGCPAITDIPHFAYQDFDDYDVVASGGITGLSSLDDIEIETAYFNPSPTTVAYAHHVRLKADGASGDVTTALTTDKASLGYLSRYSGPHDIRSVNSGVTPDPTTGEVLVLTLMTNYERAGNQV